MGWLFDRGMTDPVTPPSPVTVSMLLDWLNLQPLDAVVYTAAGPVTSLTWRASNNTLTINSEAPREPHSNVIDFPQPESLEWGRDA